MNTTNGETNAIIKAHSQKKNVTSTWHPIDDLPPLEKLDQKFILVMQSSGIPLAGRVLQGSFCLYDKESDRFYSWKSDEDDDAFGGVEFWLEIPEQIRDQAWDAYSIKHQRKVDAYMKSIDAKVLL
jgi:hypothetical protein